MSNKAIVIDNGTYQTRIGFAGEDTPTDIYLTNNKVFYNGENPPMKKGLINDFEAMDKVWRYGFNEGIIKNGLLDTPIQEYPVILSETTLAPKFHTERITQHLFEQYEVPGLYIANQALLSLYSLGKTTGLICDVGFEQTRITPIYEGIAFTHASDFINIGGKHINECLKLNLMKSFNLSDDDMMVDENNNLKVNNHLNITNQEEFNKIFTNDVIEQIKLKLCFVTNYEYSKQMKISLDSKQKAEEILLQQQQEQGTDNNLENNSQEQQLQSTPKKKVTKSTKQTNSYYKEYTLPDGRKINIGQIERFSSSEILFNPSLHLKGKEYQLPGIHYLLNECANLCDFDTKKEMLQNIIVSGSTCLLNGFSKRLKIEVKELVTASTNVDVHEPKDPSNSVWYGASILSSLSSFQTMWIKKVEYNEYGPQIIHRRTY
ncbi:hypothetical protein ABK040_004737 [Willaertia magna]